MKLSVFFALALVLTALFATCSKPPVEKSPAQELVIGEQFDLTSFDPKDGMLDDTHILVYNGLVEVAADFTLTPGLAESWTMSEDGTTWTFNLRRGVRFHDGADWNAQAALANFKRLEGYPGIADILSTTTPDDFTVVALMKKPTYSLAANLARTMLSMVSPKAITPDGALAYEAGSGPYVLKDWDKNRSSTFEAFDDYWGGKPALRKVTFKVIPDAASRALALEAGEIDMMSGYQSLGAIKRFQNDTRFQIISTTQNTSAWLLFNMEKPPLNDVTVRAAIAGALDVERLVTSLLPGLAVPATGFFSPVYGDLVNPGVKNPPYDPALAKRLTAETPLSLTLTYSAANSEDALLAPAMQDMLKEAGIGVTLNPVDGAALDDALEQKTFDMVLVGQSFIPTTDTLFHYRQGYWHSESYYNMYSTPRLDALINDLESTMDSEKRKEINWRIQEEIASMIPFIMVFHRTSIRIARAGVKGFVIGAGSWHINRLLKDVSIE